MSSQQAVSTPANGESKLIGLAHWCVSHACELATQDLKLTTSIWTGLWPPKVCMDYSLSVKKRDRNHLAQQQPCLRCHTAAAMGLEFEVSLRKWKARGGKDAQDIKTKGHWAMGCIWILTSALT